LLAASIFGTACNNKAADKKENAKEDSAKTNVVNDSSKTPMPGSDRDEHGCIGSAGYTWSVLKKECIRIFEAGTKLNPAEAVTDKTTVAYAVFSPDNNQAELFIPREASSMIMDSGKPGSWTKGEWLLEKTVKGFVLKKSGIIQYGE
jgi:hypothetical protein